MNSSPTLQGEEGQEESQHPDAVQPVGPHASVCLSVCLFFFLALLLSRSLFLKNKMGFLSPFFLPGLCSNSSDNPVQRKLTHDGQIPK